MSIGYAWKDVFVVKCREIEEGGDYDSPHTISTALNTCAFRHARFGQMGA
jgi:hypothetical protein